MFFDEPKQDEEYNQILCSIAKVQEKLLNCHFHWQKRTPITNKNNVFFKLHSQNETEYNQLLSQLELLKAKARDHRQKMGYRSGIFWWDISWKQVEKYLIYDLTEKNEENGWRFERNWEIEKSNGNHLLFLCEEGHCSNFSGHESFERGIISDYDEDEIHKKVRDFNHMMNVYDLLTTYDIGSSPVQSVLTGAEYKSASDYMFSAEHIALRFHMSDQYAHKYYQDSETTTITLTSNSRHYKAIYATAEYKTDARGNVEKLNIYNYELCRSQGDIPFEVTELYANKDAAIACAAYLADCQEVTSVSMKLFGKNITEGSVSFSEALRQAEIYTCLAKKIK